MNWLTIQSIVKICCISSFAAINCFLLSIVFTCNIKVVVSCYYLLCSNLLKEIHVQTRFGIILMVTFNVTGPRHQRPEVVFWNCYASEKMFPVKAEINKKNLWLILDITNILQIPACYIQASFQMHSGIVWWPSRFLSISHSCAVQPVIVCVYFIFWQYSQWFITILNDFKSGSLRKTYENILHILKINIFGGVIGKSKYKHRNNNVTFLWLCSLARVKPCLKY